MTLFDYLQKTEKDAEITVHDEVYDTETYFYNTSDTDLWIILMNELAKKLTITEINKDSVCVNLSEIIEKNLPALKKAKLFIHCDIDSIMYDIDNVLSGLVPKEWMVDFVKALDIL